MEQRFYDGWNEAHGEDIAQKLKIMDQWISRYGPRITGAGNVSLFAIGRSKFAVNIYTMRKVMSDIARSNQDPYRKLPF